MKISMLALSSLLLVTACEQAKPAAAPTLAPAAAVVPAAAPTPTPTPTATAPAPAAAEPALIAVGTKMKCPVSGEDFTVKEKTIQVVHAGKRYAFCCSDCQPEFAKNPAKFASK